ncbi:MAG: lactonase family protein [Planctomycetia bacterium]|nr:lactonase family protein [Planctomycetia bacterium]
MRWIIAAICTLGWAMNAHADTYVYVSLVAEQKIQILRLNPSDGSLTPVDAVAVDGGPGSLGVDPQKKFLFASLRSTSTLASFRIDSATGKLTLISSATRPTGEGAAYVTTDRAGRWLLSASYGLGRAVVHRLSDDGKIVSPAVDVVETAKTAHSVATDPDNNFVFVPHPAPNAIFQFKLDHATGKLTDAGKAPGGTPAGSATKTGPRHLAFHPTLKLAFTSDEAGSSITAYRFDPTTGLKPVQTVSTLPADYKASNSTAEVKVHPSGRFVWVSNRGHDSLAGFSIDPSGALTAIDRAPTEKTPRSFDIEPQGRYVFGAGEGSGKLAVFQVDTTTGQLTRKHTYELGKSLTWVLAVETTKP